MHLLVVLIDALTMLRLLAKLAELWFSRHRDHVNWAGLVCQLFAVPALSPTFIIQFTFGLQFTYSCNSLLYAPDSYVLYVGCVCICYFCCCQTWLSKLCMLAIHFKSLKVVHIIHIKNERVLKVNVQSNFSCHLL